MSDYVYTCERAARRLTEVVRLLGSEGILQLVPDQGLIRQCITPCGPCCRQQGPRRCTGWKLDVDRDVITFRPIAVKGNPTIRLAVSATSSFQRSRPQQQGEWNATPLATCTVTFEVFEHANDALLERHHVDLANPRQDGPVWHLQYGGNPAGGLEDLATSWLKPPRWPMPPLDLTLLLELIAYNFFPVEWERLNKNPEWVRLLCSAEQLVASHFANRMTEHFRREPEDRDSTWLSAQDNLTSGFDPRPG